MEIKINEVPFEQKMVLRNLMELYQYDFSELSGEDINEYGLYDYKYLDNYWTEENRVPYLIKVDQKIAGFVLVNDHILELENENAKALAEFFIMRKYRRQNIGTEVALRIFSTHSGTWQVTVNEFNKRGLAFWTKVIANYSGGKYEEIRRDDDVWKGRIFNFTGN